MQNSSCNNYRLVNYVVSTWCGVQPWGGCDVVTFLAQWPTLDSTRQTVDPTGTSTHSPITSSLPVESRRGEVEEMRGKLAQWRCLWHGRSWCLVRTAATWGREGLDPESCQREIIQGREVQWGEGAKKKYLDHGFFFSIYIFYISVSSAFSPVISMFLGHVSCLVHCMMGVHLSAAFIFPDKSDSHLYKAFAGR